MAQSWLNQLNGPSSTLNRSELRKKRVSECIQCDISRETWAVKLSTVTVRAANKPKKTVQFYCAFYEKLPKKSRKRHNLLPKNRNQQQSATLERLHSALISFLGTSTIGLLGNRAAVGRERVSRSGLLWGQKKLFNFETDCLCPPKME